MVTTYPGLDETRPAVGTEGAAGAHSSLSAKPHCLPCFSLSFSQIQKRVLHHEIHPNSHDASNRVPQDGGRV